jgi:DnaJ-class molecular chaperone
VTRRISGRDEDRDFVLDVMPGWRDGTRVTYEGEGDQKRGRRPQNLVFVIQEAKHRVFQRERDDSVIAKTIPLEDALCGFRIRQKGIDGSDLALQIDDVVTPGTERTVVGHGMPKNGYG